MLIVFPTERCLQVVLHCDPVHEKPPVGGKSIGVSPCVRVNETHLREQELNPVAEHLVALGAPHLTGLSDLFEPCPAIRACAGPCVAGKGTKELAHCRAKRRQGLLRPNQACATAAEPELSKFTSVGLMDSHVATRFAAPIASFICHHTYSSEKPVGTHRVSEIPGKMHRGLGTVSRLPAGYAGIKVFMPSRSARTSGSVTLPSSCWNCSTRAGITRLVASPEAFSEWMNSVRF